MNVIMYAENIVALTNVLEGLYNSVGFQFIMLHRDI